MPFEVVPFKASAGTPKEKPKQRRVYAVPQKAHHAITMPRVLGYSIGVRNRVRVDWSAVAGLTLNPMDIPTGQDMAALLNGSRPSVQGPGGLHGANLEAWRAGRRVQQLAFEMAADLTRMYVAKVTCEAPAHVLFPQVLAIVQRYLDEKLKPLAPAKKVDAFLAPYYGWIIERLVEAIQPDTGTGEAPELPDVNRDRPCETGDISIFTTKPVKEVVKSHVNLAAFDTLTWERSAGYLIDSHPAVRSFVKNHGLNFAIPYLHSGEPREYILDFIIRLEKPSDRYLIMELKGADWDRMADVKAQAALRWCAAVNASGDFGHWEYALAMNLGQVVTILDAYAASARADPQYGKAARMPRCKASVPILPRTKGSHGYRLVAG